MRPILMKGHERPLTFLQYNRDGDLLFSCAKDHNPTVWFADNGERLGNYKGHNGAVWSCSISRDSSRLLTASADQTVKLWSVQKGEQLFTFNFEAPARSVDFSTGDRRAVITTDPFMKKTSEIHVKEIAEDVADQKEPSVLVMRGPTGRINRAVWGPLNKTIISGGEDAIIRVWDPETGKEVKSTKDDENGHKGSISSLCLSADGSHFLTGSLDKTAKLWDTRSLKLIKTYATERPVLAVTTSPLLDHTGPGSILRGPLESAEKDDMTPRLYCDSHDCPGELLHPPDDCNVNSSLSFTLQICRVEDVIVEGLITGSVIHFHRARTIGVRSSGVVDASGLGICSRQCQTLLKNLYFCMSVWMPWTFRGGRLFFTELALPSRYEVRKKQFFRNFSTITLYGVVGTMISFGVISGGAYLLFQLLDVGSLDAHDYFALGAIFAATDSVSTLQVLNQEDTPLVYSLVFGESVVNDATSLVLFHVNQRFDDVPLGANVVPVFTEESLYLSVFSILLGVSIALLCACTTKKLFYGGHSPVHEISAMILMAYLSYMLAELFKLSGILSIFFCGMAMSHYTSYNVTKVSRTTTKYMFATMSDIAEKFIFLYVGMDALDVQRWEVVLHRVGTSLAVSSALLILVLLGRAMSIFPLSYLVNLTKTDPDEKIEFKRQVIIWWAGLMRGSVTMALAYNQFTKKSHTHEHGGAIMITSTISVICFSTVIRLQCYSISKTSCIPGRVSLRGSLKIRKHQEAVTTMVPQPLWRTGRGLLSGILELMIFASTSLAFLHTVQIN